MIVNYKNGFDFVKANPPLHHAAKRLHLPTQAKQMLSYFDDLIHEITDEFMRYLRGKFTDIKFITQHLAKSIDVDPKLPLPTLLNHCFPILYGMQQRSDNKYTHAVNQYLKHKVSDTERKMRDKVCLLIFIFHQLAESKQLLHIIAKKAEAITSSYSHDSQLTSLVKNEIQTHCNALSRALDQGRFAIASNTKEQNVFAGLISRAKGFSSFTEKKLNPYCGKEKIA